jgi:hypothetical protein
VKRKSGAKSLIPAYLRVSTFICNKSFTISWAKLLIPLETEQDFCGVGGNTLVTTSKEEPKPMLDSTKPRCEHIRDNGKRCGTPPVKGRPFCYYHGRLHSDFILPGHPAYVAPLLESNEAVQLALHHIYVALSKNLLDPQQARVLLATIRLAQQNLNRGASPSYDSTDEITPKMQELHDNLRLVMEVSEHAPRSTDITTPRPSAPDAGD